MKKYFGFIVFLLLLFLVGCVDSVIPSDEDNLPIISEPPIVTEPPIETEEPVETNHCTYTDDSALLGFSDYSNINKVKICKEYLDLLAEMPFNLGVDHTKIIFHDEEELVFLGSNGIYYRFKEEILEEHDIYNVLIMDWITPGVLGYVKTSSTLYAIQSNSQISGGSVISHIYQYNLDTKTGMKLPIDLGRDPKFVYAGMNGYVIEARDKLLIFDGNFELIKESTEAVFLGASKYHIDKENIVALVGETIGTQCQVTMYNGSSTQTINLDDTCNSVQRLNVFSEQVYFVINYRLYQFDALTKTFSLVPLTTDTETVQYVVTDSIYSRNRVYALKLSQNFITVFNKNMDISQSANAMEVIQVGETYYLAKRPNSDLIFVYNFDESEVLEIEEDFNYTEVKNNHLVVHTTRCTLLFCQNIYKNGIELVLSDVMWFHTVDNKNAVYIDNLTDTTYDIMHINFETNFTKKIVTLNYSTDPYVNYNSLYALPNQLILIRDSITSQYHFYDSNGDFIESLKYIGHYKTASSAPQVFLLRENGEVISFDYFL
ncbi:MAG: hypothetical protein KKH92_06915 [Firmicutes bacterium]|nr:hypothetical protein [Bacillota bacterium]